MVIVLMQQAMCLNQVFELLKIFLPLFGAIIGAFFGSYLASYWTEKRRLKGEHWEDIRENLLKPLLTSIEDRIPIVKNRTLEKTSFLYMIKNRLSPSWKDELYKDVDPKLREVSLKEHFPNLAKRLKNFEEALSDYDEKYISLAQELQTVMLSENIQEERLLEIFVKYFAYRLLKVSEEKLRTILTTMDDAHSVIFEKKSREIANKEEIKGLNELANKLIELSKEIHGEAVEIEENIRDIIKCLRLKGECRYCKF